jgi:hypothetical protein
MVTPQLPSGWNEMTLKNIIAFGGRKIDIEVTRNGRKIGLSISVDGIVRKKISVQNGTKTDIKL